MTRPASTAARLALSLAIAASATGAAHAQSDTATYTITFQGLWTADDITDANLPGGAHFTEVVGATHNSATSIWVSGGTASAGVENVAELGSTGTLVSEIGANANADAVVRAGSSFISPTQTVSGTFTARRSHPLVSVLSMVAPTPDWFVGVSSLSLYDNGWRNRSVDLYPYDAGTEDGSGWSLSNPATSPQGVITSISNSGRFLGNPIARLSFTSDSATDDGQSNGGGSSVPPPVSIEPRAFHYMLPLLVLPAPSGGPQGVLRILNGADESGTVDIYGKNDLGNLTGRATFTLDAWAAVEFTAEDLRSGNAMAGLTGGIGAAGNEARLEVATDLQILPLAYVRAADGTLGAMHDTVRRAAAEGPGQFAYDVPVFNPSTEMVQASSLRLINPGDERATITIRGRDDSGVEATGGAVTLTLAADNALTLTAQQLEAGTARITGRLGAGAGKWRLRVSSDRPLQVVNVTASSAGYWSNLSTTAAAGPAPVNLAALNRRFVGERVVYETGAGQFTLNATQGGRFTETGESGGVETSHEGAYGYQAIGPDAGRLTLMYDDGVECRASFYFESRTGGWFASHCTGSDDPEGFWQGGNWYVRDPGDTSPAFAAGSGPGDLDYTVGTAIAALTLPEANDGNGVLSYTLSPGVPGLNFDAATRRLSGTPSAPGSYSLTYAVTDEDGDSDTLDFTITVNRASTEPGSLGVCFTGMLVGIGQSCTYPGTLDEFSVNVRGRGSFLGRLAGIRIRIDNETIDGRVYDFEASHQGEGLWRIDRVP